MVVIPCVQTVFCDVDDTIVMWNPSREDLEAYGVDCEAPGTLFMNDQGQLEMGPRRTYKILPHRFHIEQLKKHKMRGHTVIVWSAGGWEWAAAAVKALGLQDYVDLVISKPTWTYDDLKPEEFMPKSQWKPDEKDKL